MQTTLNPKQADPHDVLVVASDAAPVAPGDRVAPADRDFVTPVYHGTSAASGPQTRIESDFSDPSIPPVDTTFRAADVSHVHGLRPSRLRRALRGLVGLLLAACIGVAAMAWQSKGDVARRLAVKWVPQFFLTSSSQAEDAKPAEQASPPAAEAAAVQPAASQPPPTQPATSAQSTASAPAAEAAASAAAAPSPDSTQLLQSMAGDLAAVKQQVEQLRTSIDQLKARQEQMAARVSDQNARPRIAAPRNSPPTPPASATAAPRASAAPVRSAAAPVRRPVQAYIPPPPAGLPRDVAPVPRQADSLPPVAEQPPLDPELASAPRPPMPLR